MLRAHAAQLYRASIFVDVVAGACLFLGWYGLQLDSPLSGALPDWRVLALLGVASLSWPIAAYHLGLYGSQRRRNIYQLTGRLLVLAIVSGLSLASADLLLGRLLPRRTVLLFIGSQFAFITLIRLIAFASLQKIRRSGRNYRNLLVIGSGPRARRVQEIVSARPEWGLHIVGFVDPEAIRVDCGLPPDAIHKPMEVLDLLREEAVDEVIVACPRSMLDRIGPIVETCATAGVPLTLMADLFGDSLPPPRVTYLGSLVALSFAPVHHSPIKLRIKRAIDVVGQLVPLREAASHRPQLQQGRRRCERRADRRGTHPRRSRSGDPVDLAGPRVLPSGAVRAVWTALHHVEAPDHARRCRARTRGSP
jgi:hypothetical protein